MQLAGAMLVIYLLMFVRKKSKICFTSMAESNMSILKIRECPHMHLLNSKTLGKAL